MARIQLGPSWTLHMHRCEARDILSEVYGSYKCITSTKMRVRCAKESLFDSRRSEKVAQMLDDRAGTELALSHRTRNSFRWPAVFILSTLPTWFAGFCILPFLRSPSFQRCTFGSLTNLPFGLPALGYLLRCSSTRKYLYPSLYLLITSVLWHLTTSPCLPSRLPKSYPWLYYYHDAS